MKIQHWNILSSMSRSEESQVCSPHQGSIFLESVQGLSSLGSPTVDRSMSEHNSHGAVEEEKRALREIAVWSLP